MTTSMFGLCNRIISSDWSTSIIAKCTRRYNFLSLQSTPKVAHPRHKALLMSFTVNSEIFTFGGRLLKLSHESVTTKTKMNVNLYLPKAYFTSNEKIPVLYYLSGLTCSPQNCSEKGGVFPHADEHGIAVVFPDTSPKEVGIEGATDSWDFGEGASFYLNATKEPYKKNFQMHDYILKEIPLLGKQYEKLDFNNKSIFGHSMGGFGALIFFLRNNTKDHTEFKSVSAFAPICDPTGCPWGKKAFSGYLESEDEYAAYDPIQLIKKYEGVDGTILVHQGTADGFYKNLNQLNPANLVAASKGTKFDGKVKLHLEDGFDHSYFFISSFMKSHIAHHAKYLKSE